MTNLISWKNTWDRPRNSGSMKIDHNPLGFAIAIAALLSGSCNAGELLAESLQKSTGSKENIQPVTRTFSIHDIDQDGLLNREEYRLFQEHIENRRKTTGHLQRGFSPPPRFEDIDDNGDGSITEDEMISVLNKRLRKHRRYRHQGGRW